MNETEQMLEDKYGSLKQDLGQDETGIFFVIEDDNGKPESKCYIDDKDIPLLQELNLI